jgi:hypothetical protein
MNRNLLSSRLRSFRNDCNQAEAWLQVVSA